MKLSGNQRKLYLLSAVLLALTFVLLGAWKLLLKPASYDQTPETVTMPALDVEATAMPTPAASSATVQGDAVLPSDRTVDTVVYYQDNYGYLVPVMRSVPEEEGIAKATLSLMVQSAYNDMEAARLGLRTVMPEGTQMELDITQSGEARIDLSKEVLGLADAEAESIMVNAIVQTLTEFPTVDSVSFLVDGQERETLTHGTPISGKFTRGALNLESAPASLTPDVASTVSLYFPGESSSLIVPVTRMVYGPADISTAVLELTKGPSTASPLDGALPSGCGLIGVTVSDGEAVINFTREFINIAENSDGGRAALKALVLTCTQFDDVDSVRILVEGEPYDPGASTLAVPTFINDASSLAEEYVRTQTAALLEME